MDYETLKQFEDLIAFSDQDLYGWFFEKKSIPPNAPGFLIKAIQEEEKIVSQDHFSKPFFKKLLSLST